MRRITLLLLPVIFVALLAAGGLPTAIGITIAILMMAVVTHELGHLVAARLLGVRVDAFSVGFGPLLGSRTVRGIDWQIRALPLGGFVALHGEAPGSSTDSDSFTMAGRPRRALILAAGVATNFAVGALILYVAVLATIGFHPVEALTGSIMIVDLVFSETARVIVAWLPMAASRPLDFPLTGVPGMAVAMNSITVQGPLMVVVAAATLCASLGVINLLPIPPTDGGQLLLDLLSNPRKGKTRVRHLVAKGGFISMIALAVVVTGLDVVRIALGQMPGL